MRAPEPATLGVSRETFDRLNVYVDLLLRWNPKINLVSRASLDNLWTRHIIDSLQVYELAPDNFSHWVDLGSGGGFPGLVAAIASAGEGRSARFTLIESDARKSAFLRTVIRETGLNAIVITQRIESLPSLQADLVSARALADLRVLLGYAHVHLSPTGSALFPKGETWQKELEEARQTWQFEAQSNPSVTDPRAVILTIRGISSA